MIHYKADELTTPHTTNYDGGIFLTVGYKHTWLHINTSQGLDF